MKERLRDGEEKVAEGGRLGWRRGGWPQVGLPLLREQHS